MSSVPKGAARCKRAHHGAHKCYGRGRRIVTGRQENTGERCPRGEAPTTQEREYARLCAVRRLASWVDFLLEAPAAQNATIQRRVLRNMRREAQELAGEWIEEGAGYGG